MELPRAKSEFDSLFSSGTGQERVVEPRNLEEEVTALFDDLRSPLLRYLSSFGLAVQDSEEVIQEVFMSLFLHLRAGKPRSNIRGWIFRVAHNLGLKRRQRNQRTLKLVCQSGEHAIEAHLDAAPDPEQHASSLQRRERLLAIVNALPESDRRCLYLRAEGLRYREIAQILGLSVGGVALSLSRALTRLSKVDGA
jgi:RNA polymerase sigma-70 factor (ECF subfamily)